MYLKTNLQRALLVSHSVVTVLIYNLTMIFSVSPQTHTDGAFLH